MFEYCWRNKWLTASAETIDDMIRLLSEAADELRMLKSRGVTLDDGSDVGSDYATLVTDDPAVAQEFGFEQIEHDDQSLGNDEVDDEELDDEVEDEDACEEARE